MDKQIILQKLIDYYEQYGKAPISRTWASKKTVRKYFGTWNNALKEAGIPINKEQTKRSTIPCATCGNPTKNPRFCSITCAVTTTNKETPRRKKKYKICVKCEQNLIPSSRTICDECLTLLFSKIDNMPIQDLIYERNDSGKYNKIRSRARTVYKAEIEQGCEKCGYNKHAEVCHIKAINSFDKNTLVKVVNDRTNIKILCPNCHWELDNL
jgi:hypothetical protein